jgi:hypothetical protein
VFEEKEKTINQKELDNLIVENNKKNEIYIEK